MSLFARQLIIERIGKIRSGRNLRADYDEMMRTWDKECPSRKAFHYANLYPVKSCLAAK